MFLLPSRTSAVGESTHYVREGGEQVRLLLPLEASVHAQAGIAMWFGCPLAVAYSRWQSLK